MSSRLLAHLQRPPRPSRPPLRVALTGAAIFGLGCALACGPRASCPQPSPGEPVAAGCATACPAWSARRNGVCACNADATPWLGACIAPSLVSRACGTASALVDGVCVAKACGEDQVFDDVVGSCVAWSTVKPGEATGGLPPAPDERIQCPADATLLVSRGRARCLPRYACARGLVSTEAPPLLGAPDAGLAQEAGLAREAGITPPPVPAKEPLPDGAPPLPCEQAPRCAPGSLADGHACASFMSANGFVDPARWLRLTAGEEGGAGSRWVCEPLDVLGLKIFDPRGVGRRISLQLDIPSNDVSQASLTARSEDAAEGTQRLEKGLEPYAEAFRSLGGTATTTQAAVHVICRVPASPRPVKAHVTAGATAATVDRPSPHLE